MKSDSDEVVEGVPNTSTNLSLQALFRGRRRGCKSTTTHVILSQPIPRNNLGDDARHRFSKLWVTELISVQCCRRGRTKSTTSWFDKTSQMPSQASTRNSSYAARACTLQSGAHVMICASCPR